MTVENGMTADTIPTQSTNSGGESAALRAVMDRLSKRLLDPAVVERARERDRVEAEWRFDQSRDAAERRLDRDLGARYQNLTLDAFDLYDEAQGPVVEQVAEFSRTIYGKTEAGCGVVLFGPVGTGKDHLAAAMLYAAVRAGLTARWINAQRLYAEVSDVFHDSGRLEGDILAGLIRADVLCVSDPCLPYGMTDSNRRTLYKVVSARYDQGRPTWVTMNVTKPDVAIERLGRPTWSRLCDRALMLFCNWPDYRTRKAK